LAISCHNATKPAATAKLARRQKIPEDFTHCLRSIRRGQTAGAVAIAMLGLTQGMARFVIAFGAI